MNAGLSVSRVAGAAQKPRDEGGRRAGCAWRWPSIASWRRLLSLAPEIDRATEMALNRGMRMRETLKQGQHQPMAVEDQVAIFYAATNGFLDDVPMAEIGLFEARFITFLHERRQGLRQAIAMQGELSANLEQALRETVQEFKSGAGHPG